MSTTFHYSLIAFNESVTFWLQRVRSLPCACAYVALFARRLAYNHYAIPHAYNAANTHAQGSDPARWSQKVTLSLKAIRVYLDFYSKDRFYCQSAGPDRWISRRTSKKFTLENLWIPFKNTCELQGFPSSCIQIFNFWQIMVGLHLNEKLV